MDLNNSIPNCFRENIELKFFDRHKDITTTNISTLMIPYSEIMNNYYLI